MTRSSSGLLIERFFTPGLAQVAYAIADQDSGVAAVIDPRRDVEDYLRWAEVQRVRIETVLETHIHADFVSGACDLAAATQASILASRLGEQPFAADYLDDGDDVQVGRFHLTALATPGHTPEHLGFLLTDPTQGAEPIAFFSGDVLFVGEVGRPDLLGEAQTSELVRQLYRSVQRLKDLEDSVIVCPGHTAGSSCGKKIGDAPTTTIGQEKAANYAFKAESEAEFISKVLTGMSIPPTYYPVMKRVNQTGLPLMHELPLGLPLSAESVARKMKDGAFVIDARSATAFGVGHIPGAHFVGLGPDFTTWIGWLAPYDRELILVLDDDDLYDEAKNELHRIGLDRIAGYLEGGMPAWKGERTSLSQVTPAELSQKQSQDCDELVVLDVRSDEEWRQGHIAGAVHQFAGELACQGLPRLKSDMPAALICGSGYRSVVVASLLEAHGYRQVVNVAGGMDAWDAAGLPTESGHHATKGEN